MNTTKTLTSKSMGQDINNKGSLGTRRMHLGVGLTNTFWTLVLCSRVIRERWPRIEEQHV